MLKLIKKFKNDVKLNLKFREFMGFRKEECKELLSTLEEVLAIFEGKENFKGKPFKGKHSICIVTYAVLYEREWFASGVGSRRPSESSKKDELEWLLAALLRSMYGTSSDPFAKYGYPFALCQIYPEKSRKYRVVKLKEMIHSLREYIDAKWW